MENVSKEVFEGTVCFFSNVKGWGFILWEKEGVQQKDIFCYYSDIAAEGYKTLKKNQKVAFELGLNHKSQLKAVNIRVLP